MVAGLSGQSKAVWHCRLTGLTDVIHTENELIEKSLVVWSLTCIEGGMALAEELSLDSRTQ
jgi:hypothetical protein